MFRETENKQQKDNGWILPAAAAAASLGTQLAGQARSKKQQKEANLYNLDMWNKTNEYNSPQKQMERYQAAGLNPNLIYGSGNASSGNSSPAPEFKSLSEVNYKPLDTGQAMNTLQSFTDWDIKKAQTDNLKSQSTRNVQGAALDAARTAGELTSNARSSLELKKAKQLEQTSYDMAEAQLKKTLADTQYTLNQDERATIQTDTNLRESVVKIASMKLGMEQTKILMKNANFDSRVKELDAYMAQMGIRPHDPFYAKMIAQLLDAAKTFLQPDKNNTKPWWKIF